MSDIFKLGTILALVTVTAAFVLAEIYGVTKPRIELQKHAKTLAALEYVIPQAQIIEPVSQKVAVKDKKGNTLYQRDEIIYYKAFSDKERSKIVGYAFKALGNGYTSGSPIETVVGVDSTGKIIKIKIVSQRETPGLGALCEENGEFDGKKWSTEQFNSKTKENLNVDKDGGDIVSITGATITSRAITNSIREKLNELLLEIKDNS
jgi:electron transport complex protein RnfG